MQIQGVGEVARDQIAFRGGSVPEFLRKPIATCDFPEGSGPLVPPLDLPMIMDSQHSFKQALSQLR